ncbi:bifunctional ADP-dependent NAD(P)H-hydrate dehydratase/NAD(P)H-hydrate epimerase [Streptomyces sp. ID03-2B]|uniref:bifunctional ADP-dependent NAD(P)H-hydrate dehydratase/NAD(P)H-hydrate epimerase n=1 Tax=Streptomyces TaxID=1883 RepID=UPI0004ABA633|nr:MULTISPECIES: bifunctional ADP-dependent NAD(P)H-hydrate dehydratase/NAD(P)H-hydrate epimerase [Streptomyces]MCL6287314.1 bifunctional ADP-dependent NAD(P)H-hydrate dehydratase/NAD(P)H-hydrate epimerase [Streptomyces sp. 43Y-GA-1]MCX4711060.1 bifunctional ADP-dependent NAD(P)H-hydrate dehydratase/NAD(P)H-hydrate epimerase [Streptomyces griseus]MDX2673534.1 bifunctional ADP-dependent NAD(P)H-hydrate dehydratase/NAD(P)H-hydrate epimerase [Streptomyces sp. NRRL_ISP-5395]MDX3338998.1 bifunctiona
MRRAYSVETVRAAEAALMQRLPEGALMQRAAAGLAAACGDLLRRTGRVYGSRVLLLVGSGDNGGDALYAGARLARRGAGVRALLLAPDRAHPGGLAALLAAGGRVVDGPDGLGALDLVVDGITGIGGRGGLREDAAELLHAVTRDRAPVLSVDLPSGVEADTGEVHGDAVRADATVTFGTYKPGLLIDPAAEHAGALRLVDIGLGPELPEPPDLEALQYADVAALLPVPGAESDKYRRGVVGVVAGSERYPGAAVLAVAGALRGGAGAVRYVGPGADAVIARFPEALVHAGPPSKAGRVQAWVVGPGLGDGRGAAAAVADVLAADVPVLVDADGLRLLDAETVRTRTAPTVLTPHAGEAAALLGTAREEVESGRLTAVRELAARYRATVLLKGSTTLIAEARDTPVRVNPTGTAWLATAGSGDVLSGLTGSLLAAGLAPRDAASVAAHLHGLAARHGSDGAPVSAQDVADRIPAAWRDVRAG